MIYAHWLAVRCSVQHRRPMFSRTASTVRLYLYHKHYVLSFLSFGPSSGRGEIPNNPGGAGGVRMLMGRPAGLCFTPGRGRCGWGDGAQYWSDAHEAGFISPAGIAWSLEVVYDGPLEEGSGHPLHPPLCLGRSNSSCRRSPRCGRCPRPLTRPVPPWTCSTFPHIKAAASLTRNLAFPHQADHRAVQLSPPAGASNSFHTVASSAPRHAGKGVNGGAGRPLIKDAKGVKKLGHWGVEVQGKRPVKRSA